MIDIPVVQLHVVQSELAALAQTVQRLANKLLASGTTTPSVHDRCRRPVDQHDPENDGQLDRTCRPAESRAGRIASTSSENAATTFTVAR